jgi:CRP/FNR family transcriptional regulator, cyclic AMP receptor protein
MPSKPLEINVDALVNALPESMARLASRGVAHPYRKGSTLIEEGAQGDALYVILSGRLRAYSSNLQQDREITYGIYGPGEIVGEMGLDGDRRSASVVALEPSVCAVVTRTSLLAHIAQHPEFAFELLARVIRRARAATLTARQLALNDVYGRIKLSLEAMAPTHAPGQCVDVPRLTHRDIAARVGCSREMVSRVMKDLETGRHVQVVDGALRLRMPLPARW